jgi:hypothetical protein
MSLVDTSVLTTLQTQAAQGAQARTQQLTEHRDRTIAGAIQAGKILASRQEHYETLWASDPKGTEELLGKLAPGLVPVNEIGHDTQPAENHIAGVEDDALDAFAKGLGLTKEDLR